MLAASVLAVLLSSSSRSLDFSKVSPPLVAAAGIAIAIWLLLLGLFALFTRPKAIEAEAPTMDLGPEPPAIADYLVNHCRVTPRSIPGTLLDLAARHYLRVEEHGTTETLIRLHEPATPDLLPYERQVLQQVSSMAENGVVPLQALTLGTESRTQGWRATFYKEVEQDARARGLCEPRWNIRTWTIQRLIGFVAGALVVVVAAQAGSAEVGLGAAFLAAAGAHAALQKIFGTQSLTASGYAAASHWLGVREFMARGEAFHSLPAGSVVLWDRYMAYAAVFGLARTTLASMPMGAEDDHHAWSAYGGNWHAVRVGYPRSRIVWGRTPAGGLLAGLIMGGIGAGAVWLMLKVHAQMSGTHGDVADYIRLGSLIVAGFGIAFVVWAATTVRLAVADAGPKRELNGEVVRCRAMERNEGKFNYFVAVDEGSSPRVKSWLVEKSIYDQLHEGDVIRATISHHFCHVYQIGIVKQTRIVEPPSPAEASAAKSLAGPLAALKIEAPSVSPEALVTAEEAAAALGEPVKPAQEFAIDNEPMALPHCCYYPAASGRKAGVIVGAASGPMVSMLSRIYARRRGDEIAVPSGKAFLHGNAVAILIDDTLAMITVQGATTDPKAALTQLATQAAQRLANPPAKALA